MDEQLLKQAIRVHQQVKKNVVDIPTTETIICKPSKIFDKAIKRAEKYINPQHPQNDFYYTAAIESPFKTEPFLFSRYSDGSYPIWYGSQTIQTTVYETLYHSIKHLNAIEGIDTTVPILKKRAIYDVFCDALLISVVSKESKYPQLIDDNHHYTQKLGKYLKDKHYAGLVSPSARDKDGVNYNIFHQQTLSAPTLSEHLIYQINLAQKSAIIKKGNNILMTVTI